MTRQEFERMRAGEGYGEARKVAFAALARSQPHTHDQASLVYVLEGEFILDTAAGAKQYRPGETCRLDGHVEHAEQAGPEGAVVLVARR